jgi:hypothetical protein
MSIVKELLKTCFSIVLAVGIVWVAVASVVFAFRHPWATSTERFIYLPRALLFETIDYEEVRPRERNHHDH